MEVQISTFRLLHLLQSLLHLLQRLLHLTCSTTKVYWCGRLGQVPQPRLTSMHWLGHLPSPASPACKLALQVLLESGLIVRSYSGGRPLRRLTFPKKCKSHLKKCKSHLKKCKSRFKNVADHLKCIRRFLKFSNF